MWPGCGFRQVKCKVHLDLREQMKIMSAGYLHRSGEGRKDAVNRIRTKKKKKTKYSDAVNSGKKICTDFRLNLKR